MNKSYMIGYRFQQRVKKYLEKGDWYCIVQPRSKFPDIIAWRLIQDIDIPNLKDKRFKVMMVECKVNKYLSKEEKQGVINLLKENTCNEFLVAYRDNHKLKFYEMDESLNKQEVVI